MKDLKLDLNKLPPIKHYEFWLCKENRHTTCLGAFRPEIEHKGQTIDPVYICSCSCHSELRE